MMSTYLPFFFALTEPPLRACGSPSKSSMEVALLNDVAGRGGGIPGVDDIERGTFPAARGGALDEGGAGLAESGGRLPMAEGALLSGPEPIGGAPGLSDLAWGAGPFGGGGVLCANVLLPGSFLLTHLFSSLS